MVLPSTLLFMALKPGAFNVREASIDTPDAAGMIGNNKSAIKVVGGVG